jgi:hypothetical protein
MANNVRGTLQLKLKCECLYPPAFRTMIEKKGGGASFISYNLISRLSKREAALGRRPEILWGSGFPTAIRVSVSSGAGIVTVPAFSSTGVAVAGTGYRRLSSMSVELLCPSLKWLVIDAAVSTAVHQYMCIALFWSLSSSSAAVVTSTLMLTLTLRYLWPSFYSH